MNRSYELGAGRVVHCEESTNHHWIGTCESLVILILRDGSHSDPQHIVATDRLVSQLLRRGVAPHVMVIFSPSLSRAPSESVRKAIVEASSFAKIERAAAVIMGQGFLAATHRGAMTGVLALLRPTAAIRVVSSVSDALDHLFGRGAPGWAPLAALCEERLREAG